MNVAEFLDDVAYDLARAGFAARQLVALEFAESGRDINVKARKSQNHMQYPNLQDIFDEIGRKCLTQGIDAEHLRRITFFEEKVSLQFMGKTGQAEICSFPIDLPTFDA